MLYRYCIVSLLGVGNVNGNVCKLIMYVGLDINRIITVISNSIWSLFVGVESGCASPYLQHRFILFTEWGVGMNRDLIACAHEQ